MEMHQGNYGALGNVFDLLLNGYGKICETYEYILGESYNYHFGFSRKIVFLYLYQEIEKLPTEQILVAVVK